MKERTKNTLGVVGRGVAKVAVPLFALYMFSHPNPQAAAEEQKTPIQNLEDPRKSELSKGLENKESQNSKYEIDWGYIQENNKKSKLERFKVFAS